MAKLILTSSETRQEYELGAMNTLGRHPDNTIQILDRIISKEHCQILRQSDGRFMLRDLGSLNGTYVSGARVGEYMLTHGDEIVMGSTHLEFVEVAQQDQPLRQVTL